MLIAATIEDLISTASKSFLKKSLIVLVNVSLNADKWKTPDKTKK